MTPGFFKPLRRKIGVITLVLACVLAAMWVKSYSKKEERIFVVQGTKSSTFLVSDRTGLFWVRLERQPPLPAAVLVDAADGFVDFVRAQAVERQIETNWYWDRFGFDWGEYGKDANFSIGRITFWKIPHWPIVIPLTLLSAWLLLSKPRAGKTVSTESPPKTES
jgi:hypothetical protein